MDDLIDFLEVYEYAKNRQTTLKKIVKHNCMWYWIHTPSGSIFGMKVRNRKVQIEIFKDFQQWLRDCGEN